MTAAERQARVAVYLPALMLVTDAQRLHGRDLADVVAQAIEGGANAVQLRDKAMPPEQLLLLAQRVGDVTAGSALLFVNSDVAAAAGSDADGLHLPEKGPAAGAVRVRIGDALLISRAVHSVGSAVAAERDGADMLVVGTVFPSASHPDGPTLGVDGLRAICEAVEIPVIAIGGVTPENAGEVMRAGARGVAVVSAIMDAPNPRAAATALRTAMGAGIPA